MDEEVRKQLEYEEQFYGMSSKFFSDCFRKLILDEIEAKITLLVENLRGKLIHQSNNAENFELALEKMKKDLNTEYRDSVERLFPEIEAKISSYLHIPPTVLLKEDLPVRIGINGDLDKIRQETENLKGTFSSLLYLKQKLVEEFEEADSAIFLMEQVVNGQKLDFDVMCVEEISTLSKANKHLINNVP